MTKERTSSDQPSQSSEPSPLAISQLFQEVLEQEESKPDPPSTSHIYEKGHHLHRYLPAVPPSLTNFPAVTNPTSSNEKQLDHLHSRHQRDQNSYTLITPVRDLSGPTISPVNPFFRGTSAASRRVGRSGHGVGFVQPASYLRPRDHLIPMAPIQPARAIDGDEQLGLRTIRNFLKVRRSYDVLPLSFRLIVADTSLSIKESLNVLIQNAIVSAPMWDSSTSTFAGLLTTSDYINVIQYYFQHPTLLDRIDQLRLTNLREVEKALGVAPPETISIDPERPLYEACRRMLQSRARRIPLVSSDSQTERSFVVSVITQYRILKFVATNVGDTQKLRNPLKEIRVGTYKDIETVSMDTPVIDVIHKLVKRSISSVPIVNSEGIVYNVFEAVDVISLIKGGVYDNLSLSVGEALKKRSPDFPGIYTCSINDGLDTIFDTIRRSRVHRWVVVDDHFRLIGVLTLSDILQYILLEGEPDEW